VREPLLGPPASATAEAAPAAGEGEPRATEAEAESRSAEGQELRRELLDEMLCVGELCLELGGVLQAQQHGLRQA